MTGPVPPALSTLDRAVLAFRADPSPANRARLLTVQTAHADAFYAEQTGTFQERTR